MTVGDATAANNAAAATPKSFVDQVKEADVKFKFHSTNNKWAVGGAATLAVLAAITAVAGVLMMVAANGANLGALSALGTVGAVGTYVTLGAGGAALLVSLGFLIYSAYNYYSQKKAMKEELKPNLAPDHIDDAKLQPPNSARADGRFAYVADKDSKSIHYFGGKDAAKASERATKFADAFTKKHAAANVA